MSLFPPRRPARCGGIFRPGSRPGAPGARFASPGWPKPQPETIAEQKFRMACQEGSNLAFILPPGRRCRWKAAAPARRDEGGRIVKNRRAERSAVFDQSLAVLADGGCLLAEHSFARAGRIDEHAVKQARQRGGKAGPCPSLVTTALVTPIRSRFWRSTAARPALYSFASSSPRPASAAASCSICRPARRTGPPPRMPGRTPSSAAGAAGAGFLHIKSPGMVPWVAAGAQVCVRQPESGRRKRRWAQRQPALGPKALRGQPQRVGRDAAGRRFGRVAQQRFAAAAEQRAFPRKEGFRVFDIRSPVGFIKRVKSGEFRYEAL